GPGPRRPPGDRGRRGRTPDGPARTPRRGCARREGPSRRPAGPHRRCPHRRPPCRPTAWRNGGGARGRRPRSASMSASWPQYGLTSGTEAAVGVAAPPTTRPTRALPDTVVVLGHHGTHVLRHRPSRRPYRAAL